MLMYTNTCAVIKIFLFIYPEINGSEIWNQKLKYQCIITANGFKSRNPNNFMFSYIQVGIARKISTSARLLLAKTTGHARTWSGNTTVSAIPTTPAWTARTLWIRARPWPPVETAPLVTWFRTSTTRAHARMDMRDVCVQIRPHWDSMGHRQWP